MGTLLRRDASILSISIAAALVARFVVLFVGRPDFVGWFNHSPYFWVQAKSLIEHGNLAYGDMPLLFAIYAGLAQVISALGVPLEPAIIVASRLVMIVAPALIPVAVYLLAKSVAGEERLSWSVRCLVFASGFLPLTFANMPEHLQKNMMGLLLLAFAVLALFHWLRARRLSALLLFAVLLAAVCLTHLGTALAALLLVGALILDVLLRRSSLKDFGLIGLLSAAVVAAVGYGIRGFDPAAAERVNALIAGLLPDSMGETAVYLLVVAAWLGVLWLLWRWFSLRTSREDAAVAALGRTAILWMGLLAMPLWPGDVGMRLMLFIPLGAVVLLILTLFVFRGVRLLRYAAVVMTLAFCSMSTGEAISLYMTYPNKTQISSQLSVAADNYRLSREDLVITPYGVNPIANWFLGTKSSLLTAVQQDVFEHYDRVFVLNTLERRAPDLEPGECRLIQSEYDRYWTTRHDSPLGESETRDPDYDLFALYQLEKLPEDWAFDREGLWAGWGDCSRGAGEHSRENR